MNWQDRGSFVGLQEEAALQVLPPGRDQAAEDQEQADQGEAADGIERPGEHLPAEGDGLEELEEQGFFRAEKALLPSAFVRKRFCRCYCAPRI